MFLLIYVTVNIKAVVL